MKKLPRIPTQLNDLKKEVKELFYMGNTSLLEKPLVSVVGSRRPNSYTKQQVSMLCSALSKRDVCVVSGAAMGVDSLAHKASFPNTIAVMANSLDIIYPKINKDMILKMNEEALCLSEYKENFTAKPYTFVHRNRIVVSLSQAVVIAQADKGSGSMRSAEAALELGRPIYVLPQRLGESDGTLELLEKGQATLITDIEKFADQFGALHVKEEDELLAYCKKENSFERVLAKFGDRVYEYELDGKLVIDGLLVYPA